MDNAISGATPLARRVTDFNVLLLAALIYGCPSIRGAILNFSIEALHPQLEQPLLPFLELCS